MGTLLYGVPSTKYDTRLSSSRFIGLLDTRFVGKYVTGRRKRFRPHKVYIFLNRITSRVDLALSVCLSVRMNAEISETIRARLLRFGMQIPEFLTQRKFDSAMCHAHSNAHKPPKTVAPTVLMLEEKC